MVWLYFGFCVMFAAAELWSFFVARKRKQAVIEYVREKHPAFFQARLAAAGVNDAATGDFLRSTEDLGDPQVAALKRRARIASKFGMAPILVLLTAMVVLYVWGAVLSFFR